MSAANRPEPVTADDLALAAAWLREYNDGSVHHPDSGEHDETAAVMFRVAAWIEREVTRRENEALVRRVAAAVADGRSPRDPKVIAAARRAAERRLNRDAPAPFCH